MTLTTETTALQEAFVEGARSCLFFSQVIGKELSSKAIEELARADYSLETGNELMDLGYKMIRRYFKFKSNDPRTELACEYARIFLASGLNTELRSVATPYESVFTSEERLVMQEARDEVYRWYLKDGFKLNTTLHEPEDHLAFELEYLAHMSKRAAGLAGSGDEHGLRVSALRQREFIDAHLLNWLPSLRKTAQDYAQLTFYPGMLLVIEGYLHEYKTLLSAVTN